MQFCQSHEDHARASKLRISRQNCNTRSSKPTSNFLLRMADQEDWAIDSNEALQLTLLGPLSSNFKSNRSKLASFRIFDTKKPPPSLWSVQETKKTPRKLHASFFEGFPFFVSFYLIEIRLASIKYRGDAHMRTEIGTSAQMLANMTRAHLVKC